MEKNDNSVTGKDTFYYMNWNCVKKLLDFFFCFVVKKESIELLILPKLLIYLFILLFFLLLIYLMVAKYSPWYSARNLIVTVLPRLFGNIWCLSHMLLQGNPRTRDIRARLEMRFFVEPVFLSFYIMTTNLHPFAGLRVMEGVVQM